MGRFTIGSKGDRFQGIIELDYDALQQVLRDRYNGLIKAGTTAGLFEALQQPPYNGRPAMALHCNKKGETHDPAKGTPAVQEWHANREAASRIHYINGKLHDPDKDTPAVQKWHANGEPAVQEYWDDGNLHDPAPGLPAGMEYNDQGVPVQAKFADGRIKSNPDELQKLQEGLNAQGQAQELTQAFGDTGIQFTATPGPR